MARFLTREDLCRRGAKEGDQLGEGSRQLVFDRNGANVGRRGIGKGGVGLPENMEKNITVGWIFGVSVGTPVGRVAMQLHIAREGAAVGRGEGGA